MKYDGIVLFTDLDGTLLDDKRQLSEENLDALRDFAGQGGRFGVATGRMERTTLYNFPDLPVNTPSIFFNGALVYDLQAGKQVYGITMPVGLEAVFQDILDRYPSSLVEINAAGKAFIPRYNDIIRTQLKREGLIGVEAGWDDIPGGWFKVLVADGHERLEKVKAELDGLDRTDINIMFSEEELLDIMARDVSKGAALLRLKKANSVTWRTVFAVGDNDNDLDMIQAADVGICVANGTPSVRDAARYEVADHNIPCVPQVLKIIDQYL